MNSERRLQPQSGSPPRPPAAAAHRVFFIANCVYSSRLGGGDIHYFHMAEGAITRGHAVTMFGGQALREHLERRKLDTGFVQTDRGVVRTLDIARVWDQVFLFVDYLRRLIGSFVKLDGIGRDDVVYTVTEFWFDALPAILCKARRKVMVLHMQAPTLGEILRRSRPDVDPSRLAALHYWLSQKFSVAVFRWCRHKRLLYVHPAMREGLLRSGYRPEELKYVSFGVDVPEGIATTDSPKIYDVIWIGRIHRQKGVADLLSTLAHLASRVPNFRAVVVGNLQKDLQPEIEKLGLGPHVEFAGYVSEEDKFRLFRASRVFLMPSRFEGSPRVVAEALVCGVPVVAYDVPTYRPLFAEFLRYIPCFDAGAFKREAEDQVLKMRSGKNYLHAMDLEQFCHNNSWQVAEQAFCDALDELAALPATPVSRAQK